MQSLDPFASREVVVTRLGVFLFSDIVGSTQIKSKLGVSSYVHLLERHNQLFEAGIAETPGAKVIKHTGDGYFVEFLTASSAVRFSLVFQSRMGLEPWGATRLSTRIGIHAGEIATMSMAGNSDLVGLNADLAARIMSLAVGGQILLTRQAFDDARQFVEAAPQAQGNTPPLKWLAHGRYVFKGTDEPLEVFEVGIEGFSPLLKPEDTEKVKRSVPHEMEQTLGWRPAGGLEIPTRPSWELKRKLGEGGFGEVWLAQHCKIGDQRVFKFCFDADRLRSFKRELTLFRVLRESLGDRPDVARIYEVNLQESPFFLESEYTPGGSIVDFAQKIGGLDKLDLNTRLRIVENIAVAVAAAHSVGILHKDLKPSNILVEQLQDGSIRPKLSDFGIGEIFNRTQIQKKNITETGLTEIEDVNSSRTGTRIYAPPESLTGKSSSVQGDIYALGVLLFQMVIGDLQQPLAIGWERKITDKLLIDDIASCVDGDPANRLRSAADLSDRLANLEKRRRVETERIIRDNQEKKSRKIRRTVQVIGGVTTAMVLVALVTSLLFIRQLQHTNKLLAQERLQTQREALTAKQASQLLTNTIHAAHPFAALGKDLTVKQLLEQAQRELKQKTLDKTPELKAAFSIILGNTFQSLGDFQRAEALLTDAVNQRIILFGVDHRLTAEARYELAGLLFEAGKYPQAQTEAQESVRVHRLFQDPENRLAGAKSLRQLSAIQLELSNTEDSRRSATESVSISRELGATEEQAAGMEALGLVDLKIGKISNALAQFRTATQLRRDVFAPNHPTIADSLLNLASAQFHSNQLASAVASLEEAISIRRNSLPQGHPSIAQAASNLALILAVEGKYDQAKPLIEEAVLIRRLFPGPDSRDLADSLCIYGRILISSKDTAGRVHLIEGLNLYARNQAVSDDELQEEFLAGWPFLLHSSSSNPTTSWTEWRRKFAQGDVNSRLDALARKSKG